MSDRSDFVHRTAPAAIWVAVAALLVLSAALPIRDALAAGTVGPNDLYDDTMRFVQVRDWMAGKGWFDVAQPRLGPGAGTAMHWSRLVDLPIAALAWAMSPFVGAERALPLAATVWPPVMGAGLAGVFAWAGWRTAGQAGLLVGAVLGTVFLSQGVAFQPGRIDHHNWQALLMAVATAALAVPGGRGQSRGIVAGLAVGLSLAIGPETLVFSGMLCAFVAVLWAVEDGARARRQALAFGLALAACVSLAFMASIGPSQWSEARCDQISPVFVLAASVGGLGLAGVVATLSGRGVAVRLGGLAGLGGVCLAALLVFAPHCLSNPLAALPEPVVDMWLSRVAEARSFATMQAVFSVKLFLIFGTAACATLLLVGQSLRRGWTPGRLLLLALIAASAAFTVYQVRYASMTWLFSAMALTIGLSSFVRNRDSSQGVFAPAALAVLLAVALQPRHLAFPAGLLALSGETPSASNTVEDCDIEAVVAELERLDPSFVMAPFQIGPSLLRDTPHRVLASNYHRNVDGLSLHIDVALAEPDTAVATLRDTDIDILVVCDKGAQRFMERAPESLFAALLRGDVPDGLSPMPSDAARIYRVSP